MKEQNILNNTYITNKGGAYDMILTVVLAILFGTLVGLIFIQPYNYQTLCQFSDKDDNI